jgi:hypothetical protein
LQIVAGGGGAFMHPTHGTDFDEITVNRLKYNLQAVYPSPEISKRLAWQIFRFPVQVRAVRGRGLLRLYPAPTVRPALTLPPPPPPSPRWLQNLPFCTAIGLGHVLLWWFLPFDNSEAFRVGIIRQPWALAWLLTLGFLFHQVRVALAGEAGCTSR